MKVLNTFQMLKQIQLSADKSHWKFWDILFLHLHYVFGPKCTLYFIGCLNKLFEKVVLVFLLYYIQIYEKNCFFALFEAVIWQPINWLFWNKPEKYMHLYLLFFLWVIHGWSCKDDGIRMSYRRLRPLIITILIK